MFSNILMVPKFSNIAYLSLRVSIGALLIHHGFEKLSNIDNFADAFLRPIHIPFPTFMAYFASFSEIIGSCFLILGILTRLGAISICLTIGAAIYHAIYTSGLNIYLLEMLILYEISALSVFLLGPGIYSLDQIIINIINARKRKIELLKKQNQINTLLLKEKKRWIFLQF